MLPSMEFELLLMWRQPAEKSKIDISIMPREVRIGMMDHMFPVPHVRTGANQIHRHRHHSVDLCVVRISLMPAVVFDVETDGCH